MSTTPVVGVILNPIKNGATAAQDLLREEARRRGIAPPTFYETTEEDPGRGMAEQAIADGCTLLVAAGGDGTVRTVAEALVGKDDVTLGLMPLGTGNLLARNLGIDPEDLAGAARSALGELVEPVDGQRIETIDADGSQSSHFGLVACGVGIDAEVMNQANDGLKKIIGPAAYVLYGLGKMMGWQRHPVRYDVDGQGWETARVRTVMLVNAGYIQGGLQYAPGAALDDGVQNAVIMTPRSAAGWLVIGARIAARRAQSVPSLRYREGVTVTVRPFRALDAQVDGDAIGAVTTLRSTVVRHAVRVHVPVDEERTHPGGSLAPIGPVRLDRLATLPELTEKLPDFAGKFPDLASDRLRLGLGPTSPVFGKGRPSGGFLGWLRRG